MCNCCENCSNCAHHIAGVAQGQLQPMPDPYQRSSALRPGQKVTLSGTVRIVHENVCGVEIDGDLAARGVRYFRSSALTPVVEPEPVWSPGDHVQIDGMDYMLCELLNPQGYRIWCGGPRGETLHVGLFSERWAEGRVVVVYRKEADK